MAKVVVRFSFNGDAGSATRNTVVNELEAQFSASVPGFKRSGTGLYEASGIATSDALNRMKKVLDLLAGPGAAQLDHLFVYVTHED